MRRATVIKILDDLGVRINVRGYTYLIEAVLLINKKPHISTMEMYQTIAENHNTTMRAVERCIRHSICKLKEKTQEYFKLDYKLTNTRIIKAIEEKARRVRV